MTARLQREEEKHLAATETLMQRVKKLTTENEELSSSNATLEVDLSRHYAASRGLLGRNLPENVDILKMSMGVHSVWIVVSVAFFAIAGICEEVGAAAG